MSSYHTSFTYLDKNSFDEGLRIASFEPDNGFVDSFLSMDQITTNSYDGTKKLFYGNKYNASAIIYITLVKEDGSDFSVDDNRKVLRWLTGYRKAAWLDFYEGDTFVYSFYGNVTNAQQYKIDARVVGIQIEFSSIHPWAWSAPKEVNCYIGQDPLEIDSNGILYKNENTIEGTDLGVDGETLFNSKNNMDITFNITDDGVVYNDQKINLKIDNNSDDLYTCIDLNMLYTNIVGVNEGAVLTIDNTTLGEKSVITNISPNEIISLSSGHFIISDVQNKIFGDTFNFIWPRLAPGENNFVIDGTGKSSIKFSYRYPIKIGDCAIDIDNLTCPKS